MITALTILGMIWIWIAYEMHIAPVINDKKNKLRNEKNNK